MTDLVLHGYWRSSASYRVRIALNLKGLSFAQVTHDLRLGEQRDPAYLTLAPQGLVPALAEGSDTYFQSPAILEMLDERWPEPRLIPQSPKDAAMVRAMAAVIGCDIHPLGNLRVLQALRQDFAADEMQIKAWRHRWMGEGLRAMEVMLESFGGSFSYGDRPTLADCYLIPQLYNAKRFEISLEQYPRLGAVDATCATLPAFAAAHPEQQPDADK